MITRGGTSRSTSSVAQVRRASCAVIRRTPAAVQRVSNSRAKFLGSTGLPYRVVTTHFPPCHAGPAFASACAVV